MTPEQQAHMLAEWLERHPGSEPPSELDPEVVEAVYALRPDLAPPPRVTADDILAEVTAGPLAVTPPAPTAVGEEEEDEEGGQGAPVVPFPGRTEDAEPAPATSPRRRRTWAWGTATGTLLAMAAAALLMVRFGAPEPDGAARLDQVAVSKTEPPAEESEEPMDFEDAVAVVDTPEDLRAGQEADLVLRGTLDEAPDYFAEPVATPEPEPAPEVALARPAPMARPRPPVAPKPAARETIAEAGPPMATVESSREIGAATETPPADEKMARASEVTGSGGVGGLAATGTTSVESEPAVADVGLDMEERELESAGQTGPADNDRAFQRQELEMDPPTAAPTRRPSAGRDAPLEPEGDEVTIAESKGGGFRLFGGRKKEAAEEAPSAPAPQSRADSGPDLDGLRTRAVPPELPRAVLLSRVPGTANEDANAYAASGQYAHAGDAALSNAALPPPDGATSAAQAATWYLAGNQTDAALQAANEGIANISTNTPEHAWLWVLRGDALRAAGDPAGAAAAYEQAIRLNATRSAPARSIDASESATEAPR